MEAIFAIVLLYVIYKVIDFLSFGMLSAVLRFIGSLIHFTFVVILIVVLIAIVLIAVVCSIF